LASNLTTFDDMNKQESDGMEDQPPFYFSQPLVVQNFNMDKPAKKEAKRKVKGDKVSKKNDKKPDLS